MAEKYVTSFDGTKIFYEIKKKGDKFLIFLHGWPHNHTVWEKEIQFLCKKYSTIAPDLRGHGKSDMPENLSDYTFDKFAKDIKYIIKQEKIGNFVLIGHSFGGMIALAYYSLFPHKVDALILVDTIYENPLKHLPIIKYIGLSSLTEHLLKFILKNERIKKKHFPYVDFSRFKKHSDFFYWLKGADETALKSVLSCLEEMIEFNKKELLSKIKVPTLIIEGEKDKKTTLNDVKEMAKEIKDSRLKIVKGISHDTNILSPVAVEEYILQFLIDIKYNYIYFKLFFIFTSFSFVFPFISFSFFLYMCL